MFVLHGLRMGRSCPHKERHLWQGGYALGEWSGVRRHRVCRVLVRFGGRRINRMDYSTMKPNRPGAVNGGLALAFQVEDPWPAVTDPERSA